jgi:DNA-binding GntR family transcriptional regulator
VPTAKRSPESKQPPNQLQTDAIYEKLRELIASGQLAPGTRLVEATIARRLGASRTPVRSALHRLQQEGFATPTDPEDQRVHLMVAPATVEDGAVLYHIIGELVGISSFYAANLPRDQRSRLVEEVRGINNQLTAMSQADQPDLRKAFQLDVLFHTRCVELSSPPRLKTMYESLRPQVDRYARLYAATVIGKYNPALAVTHHERIIRAIEAGDAVTAQAAVRDNWQPVAERIAAAIEEWGESGGW